MKRWIRSALAAAMVAIAITVVYAGTDSDLVSLVEMRESQRQHAMIDVDLEVLDDLFAADATYIHSNGLFQSKQNVIDMLTKKEMRYVSFDVKEATYRQYGETVVCTGVQIISLTSSGTPFTSNSRYTVVYANINGKPRMVSYQSTLLPEIVMQEAPKGD
jgi:hypothetical protein